MEKRYCRYIQYHFCGIVQYLSITDHSSVLNNFSEIDESPVVIAIKEFEDQPRIKLTTNTTKQTTATLKRPFKLLIRRLKLKSHLYKSLGALDLLLADELTRSGVMANYNILVDFLELKTVISHFRTGHTFFHTIFPSRQEEVIILFFIGGFTAASMKQHHHFYLFDSYCRDK